MEFAPVERVILALESLQFTGMCFLSYQTDHINCFSKVLQWLTVTRASEYALAERANRWAKAKHESTIANSVDIYRSHGGLKRTSCKSKRYPRHQLELACRSRGSSERNPRRPVYLKCESSVEASDLLLPGLFGDGRCRRDRSNGAPVLSRLVRGHSISFELSIGGAMAQDIERAVGRPCRWGLQELHWPAPLRARQPCGATPIVRG